MTKMPCVNVIYYIIIRITPIPSAILLHNHVPPEKAIDNILVILQT